MSIEDNVKKLLREMPGGVELLAAVKGRAVEDVIRAVDAGIYLIGENYVQESQRLNQIIGDRVRWHFIGHLQKNKTGKAIKIFDMIETVDSLELAEEINRQCSSLAEVIPVLIEINSGREPQKHGVFPENAEILIRAIAGLPYIKVDGLMTMGPVKDNPAELSPYFRETRRIYEYLQHSALPNVEMKYLSMGMSGSYQTAIAEGANIIRIGTKIFEP